MSRLGRELAKGDSTSVVELDAHADANLEARKLMVMRFGSECAAWLVKDRREAIHKSGAFDVDVDPTTTPQVPMWFGLAVDFLRLKQHWKVVVFELSSGIRRFRFRWSQWRKFSPVRGKPVGK